MSMAQLQQLQEIIRHNSGSAKNIEDAKRKQYQFWDTQPVPKFSKSTSAMWILLKRCFLLASS